MKLLLSLDDIIMQSSLALAFFFASLQNTYNMMHRLVALLQKSPSSSNSSSSDSSLQRVPSWQLSCDMSSDEEEAGSCWLPPDVPRGYFAVYAGDGKQRFIVNTQHLSHPIFKALLAKAAEEYGFSCRGALTIPCETVLFEHFLWLLNNKKVPMAIRLEQINDLLDFYSS